MWTVGKPCSQLENYFSSHEATAAPVESAASLVRCSGMAGNTIDLIRQRLQAAATAGGSGRQEGGEFLVHSCKRENIRPYLPLEMI